MQVPAIVVLATVLISVGSNLHGMRSVTSVSFPPREQLLSPWPNQAKQDCLRRPDAIIGCNCFFLAQTTSEELALAAIWWRFSFCCLASPPQIGRNWTNTCRKSNESGRSVGSSARFATFGAWKFLIIINKIELPTLVPVPTPSLMSETTQRSYFRQDSYQDRFRLLTFQNRYN